MTYLTMELWKHISTQLPETPGWYITISVNDEAEIVEFRDGFFYNKDGEQLDTEYLKYWLDLALPADVG